MSSRWWGLTRRQTVIVFGATIVIGVLVALVLGASDTTSEPAANVGGPTRIRPGTPGRVDAVWAFGFETLRFDERLRRPEQLVGVKGFGSVFGVHGRTFMYDAASGRIGVLRSTTNRLATLGTAPQGTAQDDLFAPTIAIDGDALWLASAPGRLTRFGLGTKRADAPIALVDRGGHAPVATGVVARSGVVFAATQDGTGISVARVDAATRRVTASAHVDLASASTLDGLAADGSNVWIVTAGAVHALDAADLTPGRTISVGAASPDSVKGAVVAGGAVWTLAENGATLLRIDVRTGAVSTALKVLPQAPGTFRIPAALVTDGRHVWAMVQKRDASDDHSVRIVGYDATRRRPTPAVDLPSELFFGGLAAT